MSQLTPPQRSAREAVALALDAAGNAGWPRAFAADQAPITPAR